MKLRLIKLFYDVNGQEKLFYDVNGPEKLFYDINGQEKLFYGQEQYLYIQHGRTIRNEWKINKTHIVHMISWTHLVKTWYL